MMSKLDWIILLGLLLLCGTTTCFAVPSISSLAGTPGDGNSLTITGTGFENHPNDPGDQFPGWYTDFEDQNMAPLASLSVGTTFHADSSACMSITTVDEAEGSYSVRGNLATECADFTEAMLRVTSSEGFGFDLNGSVIFGLHRKNTSAEPTSNWKHWRAWSLDDDIYPDWYIGNAPSDGSQIYTEACDLDDGSGAHTQDYFDYVKPDSTWQFDLYVASRGVTDYGTSGAWYSRQDAALVKNLGWGFNCSAQDQDGYNMMGAEDDISNDTTTGFAYYDHVYIDTMVATYVYFTDASTLAGSTKFWMQPYTAMSTTEITIQQKIADLGSNYDNVYVRVCQYENCSTAVQLSSAGGEPGPGADEPTGKTRMRGNLKINGRVRT
jgi:hypothetical protein